MHNAPFITIISVVFNAEHCIEKTIQSVLSQRYSKLEYFVIDGKSKDKTIEIINKYASRIDRIISEPDNGIYDAMNKGIHMARGEWILFMNAGDSFCNPDVLNHMEMESVNDDISVIYGDSISVYGKDYFYFPAKTIDCLRGFGMPFCHQAVFTRHSVLMSHPFDVSYRLLADYNLFRTLFLEGAKFKYVPIPVCVYGAEGGLTNRHQWLCRQEFNRILNQEDSFASYCYFFLKSFIQRFLHPCNQFLRRCKYQKNLIRNDKISKFIY